jgi:hypothetical protein
VIRLIVLRRACAVGRADGSNAVCVHFEYRVFEDKMYGVSEVLRSNERCDPIYAQLDDEMDASNDSVIQLPDNYLISRDLESNPGSWLSVPASTFRVLNTFPR